MTYNKNPEFTAKQKQIIYGTILGGSSIISPSKGINCYLAMRDKNKEWLQYKVEMLQPLFSDKLNVIKKDKSTYRSYSVSYPIFKDVKNIFYNQNNKKIIKKSVLESLTDQAWSIWFIDAGRKSKFKSYLRTNAFGEKGTNTICEYFNSLNCECHPHLTRNRYEIVFTNSGSNEFFKIIKNKIPDFIQL